MLREIINRVRRNHGLEHATVTLMLAKQGPMRVLGRSGTDGFYIFANVGTEQLREYAHEALARLQRGESSLAVSPLCGTNIAVAGAMAGAAAYVAAAGRRPGDGIPWAILAAIAALIVSQPVARYVQKNYTTSPDLDGVEIVSVEPVGRAMNLHKVRTTAAG